MIIPIILLLVAGFLMVISSYAKAHMDTIVFRNPYPNFNAYAPNTVLTVPYFQRYSQKAQKWLWTLEQDPKKKVFDGWHTMQMIWYVTFFIGVALLSVSLYILIGLNYWLIPAAIGAWFYRLICHYIGFSRQYPVR